MNIQMTLKAGECLRDSGRQSRVPMTTTGQGAERKTHLLLVLSMCVCCFLLTWGRKGFILLTFPYHSSSLKTVGVGIQTGQGCGGRGWCRGRGGGCLLTCFPWLGQPARLQSPAPPNQGWLQPRASWHHRQAIIKQENVPQPCLQTNLVCGECFSIEIFPSKMTQDCITLTQN